MNCSDAPNQQMQLVPVTDPQGYCPIRSTLAWFATAGQFDGKTVDIRQVAFYTGMQLEELAEKLSCFLGTSDPVVAMLEATGAGFKLGDYDAAVEYAMRTRAEEILDGDIDLIWVSIGAGGAQGADVSGAYRAVGQANWAKFPNGQVTRHPQTGKVIKPDGWKPPELYPFTAHGRSS